PPPSSTAFPYTTLFRSRKVNGGGTMVKITWKLLLPLMLTVASLAAQSGYEKRLSVADVEKLTGVKGVKIVVPLSQPGAGGHLNLDRKSTRLNSSHVATS